MEEKLLCEAYMEVGQYPFCGSELKGSDVLEEGWKILS
jgi:hypothetical protein